MELTTNYNLKKPAVNEKYDVSIFNENADLIDTYIKYNNSLARNIESRVNQIENTLRTFIDGNEVAY